YGSRRFFVQGQEFTFFGYRPCMLGSIKPIVNEPDLISRTITIRPPRLVERDRREEEQFWPNFEAAKPRIFGALLDGLQSARLRRETVRLVRKPRLVDFGRWGTAAEPAFGWPEGAFVTALMANQEGATLERIEADGVASIILKIGRDGGGFEGTFTE